MSKIKKVVLAYSGGLDTSITCELFGKEGETLGKAGNEYGAASKAFAFIIPFKLRWQELKVREQYPSVFFQIP